MIKSIVWASMIDYPAHVCTSLFFEKCNFKCEYCQNQNLKDMKDFDFDKEVLPKLLERQPLVNYVILSGGECTVDKDIQKIIDILHEKGFKIGIHTNGYKPEFLKRNLEKISYIGMDIKNDCKGYDKASGVKVDINKIQDSINFIIDNFKEYEFRTTIYPKFVDEQNCINIAKYLGDKKAKKYVLQQYKPIEGLAVIPFAEEKLKNIEQECNKYIPTTLKGLIE